MKRTTPSARAMTWRAPKITISSSSGDMAESYPYAGAVITGVRYHPLPLMATATDTSAKLDVTSREAEGSRSARRLRRTGQVPGIIYGGDGEPELFAVDGRILRNTLARSGAILEVAVDGGEHRPGAGEGRPAPSRSTAMPCTSTSCAWT